MNAITGQKQFADFAESRSEPEWLKEYRQNNFEAFLASEGWDVLQWTDSPIAGGDGNREKLLHARRKS